MTKPDVKPQRRLILGASSAIAERTARIFAARGDTFYLVARNPEKLAAIASDLKARGAARVETNAADLNDFSRHDAIIADCRDKLGGLDAALIAHGDLGDATAPARDWPDIEALLKTNFLSAASLVARLANVFEAERHGGIHVITSVAGDRGRAKSIAYATAKGALDLFLQAMRQRLHGCGVHVLTVKPGYVDTPMTARMRKTALFADPARVAEGIVRAIDRKRDIVYLPGYWRLIMLAVRMIPEGIFKRMGF